METTLTPRSDLSHERAHANSSALPSDTPRDPHESHAPRPSSENSDALTNPSIPLNLEGEPRIKALRDYIIAHLDDEKAENITTIDLAGKSEIADSMIIASGRSARHVNALSDKVQRAFKEAGIAQCQVEGRPSCDWVLVDAGDIIVHLFRPEVREFYNLERIWSEAARAPVSGSATVTAPSN